MCPGFDSRTRRHMWIEFVVGSRPCSEGFSPGSPVFLPPQKPTFLNSSSIRNSRATGLSVEDCCVSPSLNKVYLLIIFFYAIVYELEIPVWIASLSRANGLIVSLQIFNVLKTKQSKYASSKKWNLQEAFIRPIVQRHKHHFDFITPY